MKRLLIAAALALAASTPAGAGEQFLALGVGGDPCADWVTGRDSNADVGNWVLGFWSGINLIDHETVGHASDGKLLAELKADCHMAPDAPIGLVVQRLYLRYQAQGR